MPTTRSRTLQRRMSPRTPARTSPGLHGGQRLRRRLLERQCPLDRRFTHAGPSGQLLGRLGSAYSFGLTGGRTYRATASSLLPASLLTGELLNLRFNRERRQQILELDHAHAGLTRRQMTRPALRVLTARAPIAGVGADRRPSSLSPARARSRRGRAATVACDRRPSSRTDRTAQRGGCQETPSTAAQPRRRRTSPNRPVGAEERMPGRAPRRVRSVHVSFFDPLSRTCPAGQMNSHAAEKRRRSGREPARRRSPAQCRNRSVTA